MGEPIIIWPPDGFHYEPYCQEYLGHGWYYCGSSVEGWVQDEYGAAAYACCPI